MPYGESLLADMANDNVQKVQMQPDTTNRNHTLNRSLAEKAARLRGQDVQELVSNKHGIPSLEAANSNVPPGGLAGSKGPKPVLWRYFNIRMRCNISNPNGLDKRRQLLFKWYKVL